jgi:UPF0271 protein
MLLNCDLGESYGRWTVGHDAAVMPHIDQANIACGFHAGDPLTMHNTLALAATHNVTIGAHPAYPDLAGFGRRSMAISSAENIANLRYQIAALEGMAVNMGLTVSYVKPHGALYHDMMKDQGVRADILEVVASYHRPLALMVQASEHAESHRAEASAMGVALLFEAFSDRCYEDDGSLLSRDRPDAVHNSERMLEQAAQLINDGTVTTVGGKVLHLQVDSLCVHGDNPEGVRAIKALRGLVDGG